MDRHDAQEIAFDKETEREIEDLFKDLDMDHSGDIEIAEL